MNKTKKTQQQKKEVLRELADMPVVVNKEAIAAKLLELTEEIDASWEEHEDEGIDDWNIADEVDRMEAEAEAREIVEKGEDAVNYLRAIEDFNEL